MAVVEEAPNGDEVGGAGELHYRLHQQSILAAFGIAALRARELHPMLQRAVELCAQGMRARHAKFLEHCPDRERLLVRVGIGWREGVVGAVEMGTDLASPGGYAFSTGEAVISNHLENEERFRTPAFMADHGIRRAINVVVEAAGERVGVIEVDSPDEGSFDHGDLAFMQGFANLIGVAIERQAAEKRLAEAVEHQELLTREASHRVKNSLALVSAMLSLQMQEEDDDDGRIIRMLGDAQARIAAIAQAHDQLWRGARVGMVMLDELIGGIARELQCQAPDHAISCTVPAIEMSADAAIPIGLFSTELITNAIKYAYGDAGGPITLSVDAADDRLVLSIADAGVGMPAGFSLDKGGKRSLGMRMIKSLARQLRGTLSFEDAAPGTRAVLDMPDPRAG